MTVLRNKIALALSEPFTEPTPIQALIAAWPQWWCRACGNRYAEHAAADFCSCGEALQAVTVQLVAKEA